MNRRWQRRSSLAWKGWASGSITILRFRATPPTPATSSAPTASGKMTTLRRPGRWWWSHRPPARQRKAGDLPEPAVSRAYPGQHGGLRQIRDFPHLERAAEPPGEPCLRGRHGGLERREHDRPLPSGSLRGHHRQLQPGRGSVPCAGGDFLRRFWGIAPTNPPRIWA